MVDEQEIYDKHPELFHYTSIDGVAGILTSQTIWSTHYKFLNDTSELQLMRFELGERLFHFVKERVVDVFRKSDHKKKKAMRKAGGPIVIARDEAMRLAETFYKTAFEATPAGRALAIPYVTSFCAHTSDRQYEQKNGLLSQWRGYAEGGYAIVFDTKKLCDLYRLEADHYYYSAPCFIGDVVYQGDEKAFEEEFGGTIEKIKSVFQEFFESGNWEVGETFGPVISMFTRLKHRGFFEEREVRSIAFPMTKELEDNYKRVDPGYVSPGKPLKRILKREDGVPYIELFDFDETPLPITRIIVGPHKNQKNAKQQIKNLIGKNQIEVYCSETPLSWPEC